MKRPAWLGGGGGLAARWSARTVAMMGAIGGYGARGTIGARGAIGALGTVMVIGVCCLSCERAGTGAGTASVRGEGMAQSRPTLAAGQPAGVVAGAARHGHRRAPTVEWSATTPRINETHIFQGGVNRRGKPVGFHSRPNGRDPERARVVQVVRPANRYGVYEALVEIADGVAGSDRGRDADDRRGGDGGGWVRKRSTFYPDTLDFAGVVAAILNAYQHRQADGGDERFRGPSGLGFTIEGYLLDDGSINTAYPIY